MRKIHVIIATSMTHHFFTIPFICMAALFSTAGAQNASEAQLKQEFEIVYNTWRQSMLRESYEGWRDNTSAYRQMKVRNMAISEKREFPASLFKHQFVVPSLMPLKYVGIVIKGPTAAVTYYGKLAWGPEQKQADNALVLLFTQEKGGWKYDQARFFNLEKLPDVRERLNNRDKTVLLEQDGFQPLGVIPPVAKPCPVPKYIAQVFTDGPGRKVDITVNGISTHNFENERIAEIISGGLKDGANTITIHATPLPNPEVKGPLLVEVYIMPEVQGDVPGKAFSVTIPEEKQEAFTQTQTFTVTPEILQKMTPATPAKK